MTTSDFFRARLDQMIDLRHPLVVLFRRIPWSQIETALAPAFARKARDGKWIEGLDLFGPSHQIAGVGVSPAGRPRLPIRLMAALLYLKHAFNLSDEELVARWSETVVWQYFSGLLATGVAQVRQHHAAFALVALRIDKPRYHATDVLITWVVRLTSETVRLERYQRHCPEKFLQLLNRAQPRLVHVDHHPCDEHPPIQPYCRPFRLIFR